MTAKDLLHQALQAGLRFEADGEHLRVRGDEAVIGAWAERVAIAAAVAERLKGRAGGDRKSNQAGNISGLIDKGETRDLAAAKAGLGSGKTLGAAQVVLAKAMQAAERIKTKTDELEKRYGDWLMRQSGGNTMTAVFGSIGFANLKGLAERTLDKQQRRMDALARFGSEQAVFADTKQECFCIDALALVPMNTDGWAQYEQEQVNAAFAQHTDLVPHTLADCLHELDFWDAVYRLRNGWDNAGDDLPEVNARRRYIEGHCMATIRPKSRQEAKTVLRYMAEREMFDRTETDAVLENLIG